MPNHNQCLISILLFISIIGYANYTNADDCFSKEETKNVLTELKNEWWTQKEQSNQIINLHSSHLVQHDGAQECIVLIESRDKKFDCHACGANLGIAIYTKNGNLWKKKFEQKDVAETGSWGKLPETARTVLFGENNIGIMFHFKGMAQGQLFEGYNLIARVEGKYKDVGYIETHYDNYAWAEGRGVASVEWNAQLHFIAGENKQFFDIQVVRKGTEEDWKDGNTTIKSVDDINVYKFSKDKYELVETKKQ